MQQERLDFDDDLVRDAIAASTRPTLAPVEITHVRDHAYVQGPTKKSRGCHLPGADGKLCRKARYDPVHHGPPPSLNDIGGSDPFTYNNAKKKWQETVLIPKLEATGLPLGLRRVTAEGACTFPDRIRRDQGNYRYFIEKALGDALQDGGWLTDDRWEMYEFGGLAYRYEKGVCELRLVIFPE